MKNNGCFAAVTGAFTVAGACIGYGLRDSFELMVIVVTIIAFVGSFSAAFCGHRD